MSIYDKIVAYDKCVYWGPPVPDGMGGNTYPAAVEIGCRWTEVKEVIEKSDGEDVTSKSKIFTSIDTVENGYLFHGLLADLATPTDDPRTQGAYRIIHTKRLTNLRNTKVLRKAWV
jgi:hypothetical protein